MEVLITNRKNIEFLSMKPFVTPTALISITDYGDNFANLKYKPQHLLRLVFDDVPVGDGFDEEYGYKLSPEMIERLEIRYHSVTREQIDRIVVFLNEVKDKVELIICQCEHGQSRSAAIAAVFIEYTYGNGIDIFANDRYYPNKSVYRTVLEKLKAHKSLVKRPN